MWFLFVYAVGLMVALEIELFSLDWSQTFESLVHLEFFVLVLLFFVWFGKDFLFLQFLVWFLLTGIRFSAPKRESSNIHKRGI